MPESKVNKKNVQQEPDAAQSFRFLANTIPTLCWMAYADGSIYWYNNRWYEFTGTTQKQMESKGWQSVHHPDEIPQILEQWKIALGTKMPFDMVVSLRNAKGEYYSFLSHIVPSKDQKGNVTGWIGIKNDITKLREADEALKASENKFKTYAEAMPQMAFIADPKGSIVFYNKRHYEYFGSTPEDHEGWGWKETATTHPDDLKRTIDAWTDSLKTGNPYEIEYRLRRHDGQYRWHLGRAVAIKDEAGTITQWMGTNTDIHEQKRQEIAQAYLSQATKELSSSLDYKKTLETVTKLCVPEIADWCSIDLLDEKGNFEQVAVAHIDPDKVNLAKEFRDRNPVDKDASTGIPHVVKTGVSEFYPLIDDALLEASITDPDTLKFMKDLQLHSIIIVPVRMRDKPIGAITFISSEASSFYTENDLATAEELANRISLAITNSMLYTEAKEELKRRKHLESQLLKERDNLEARVAKRTAQLNDLNVSLGRSNQELQDFAYVASHDLQEPLRKIQAFGDILQNEYADKLGDGADYLRRMHAAATRMSRLIEDLLAFSRVTTRPPSPSNVDLNDAVDDVLNDLENQISRTNGQVNVGDLPSVLADPTHMRQLFQNLISNALKFHHDGVPPVIGISARESVNELGADCEIRVTDNGIGFDKKYNDRIFGVFQRLHGRDTYEGTGIGLAVCRKIVERYSGTITAESHKGKGTSFIIKFPIALKGDRT